MILTAAQDLVVNDADWWRDDLRSKRPNVTFVHEDIDVEVSPKTFLDIPK